MDRNYNWSNLAFKDRCGESLNLAVNYLTDVLHSLYLEAVPWPMFRHDLRHTGYSTSKAPNTNQTLWTYTTGGWVTSSPAVADGRVYVGSDDRKVYCLNASTGALKWNYTTDGEVWSSPAIICGKVYVGSYDHKVYCLNASTGAYIWSYATNRPVVSSPAVVCGKVYVGSPDSKVYCLNASTGAYIWSYTTGNFVWSSPAIADGKVYVGSGDKNIYCLDASTGNLIWSYATGSSLFSSPAVADGRVYISSGDYKVYAFADHDVAITDVALSKTAIGRGYSMSVKVYVTNRGHYTETFTITAYANITIIESKEIILINRNSATITFTWNTTDFAKGNYIVSVVADAILGETIIEDNIHIDGTVKVGVRGDINGDNRCNLLDLVKVAAKFGKLLGDLGYDPNYDFNDDNKVDPLDLEKAAGHFGETDP